MAPSLTRRRPAAVAVPVLIAIVLYSALFPYPLGKELVARGAWASVVPAPGSAPAEDPLAGASLAPFRSGTLFGYVDALGRFARVEAVPHAVALSAESYAVYSRLGTDWVLRAPSGARLASFSGAGYPLLSREGGRAFVVGEDGSSITEVDPSSGDVLWARSVPSLLTSVCARGTLIVAGLLDGGLQVLGRGGAPLLEAAPAGSRLPVVLGTAASADGSTVAAITGIDPAMLGAWRRGRGGFSRVTEEPAGGSFRREVRMELSDDGRVLAVEGPAGVSLASTVSRARGTFALDGALAGLLFVGPGGRAVAAAGTRGDAAELVLAEPFAGGPFLRTRIPARGLSLSAAGSALLVSVDGRLLRVEVEQR